MTARKRTRAGCVPAAKSEGLESWSRSDVVDLGDERCAPLESSWASIGQIQNYPWAGTGLPAARAVSGWMVGIASVTGQNQRENWRMKGEVTARSLAWSVHMVDFASVPRPVE